MIGVQLDVKRAVVHAGILDREHAAVLGLAAGLAQGDDPPEDRHFAGALLVRLVDEARLLRLCLKRNRWSSHRPVHVREQERNRREHALLLEALVERNIVLRPAFEQLSRRAPFRKFVLPREDVELGHPHLVFERPVVEVFLQLHRPFLRNRRDLVHGTCNVGAHTLYHINGH